MLTSNDALLIVDVQRDFLPGGSLAVPGGDEVVAPLAEVGKAFATAGLPLVASRDWHPPDHCSFQDQGGPWPPHCVANTPGAELDPGLDLPEDARIIDKATTSDKDAYSAFEGTDLSGWLEREGVTRLFVGGVATEYCVQATVADARKNGFAVVILEDAIRAIDPAEGERVVRSLCELSASVTQCRDVLDERP